LNGSAPEFGFVREDCGESSRASITDAMFPKPSAKKKLPSAEWEWVGRCRAIHCLSLPVFETAVKFFSGFHMSVCAMPAGSQSNNHGIGFGA